jgi:hypothetical protein
LKIKGGAGSGRLKRKENTMITIKKDGDYLRVIEDGKLQVSLSLGNNKLSSGIAIINFGPALFCPGEALGLCKVGERCYAKSREIVPSYWYTGHCDVLDYRYNQYYFWKQNTSQKIVEIFKHVIPWLSNHGYRRLRFSEASDFYTQWYVDVAEQIATMGKTFGVICYTYTVRVDLDYSNVHNLRIHGSNWNAPNGKCVVIEKKTPVPQGFIACKENCATCYLCALPQKTNIAFRIHGTYQEAI